MIELVDQPTTQAYARRLGGHAAETAASATAAANAEARARLAGIEQAQQSLLTDLAAPRLAATVLYRVQRVYNGIAAEVDTRSLQLIATLPGVKAVHALVPKRLALASSVPFIGGPAAWSAGFTGQGVKIGIIDGGIDYIHVGLGGSGLPADYAANDPQVAGDVADFPNAKVAGGYDFAGDAYNADSSDPAARVPQPDADPFDCGGHGTHVAGIAAGVGVRPDGGAYSGPYGSGTDFSTLKIGPGVAPQATLYALKVFGCEGTTSSVLMTQALDWAVDPNADGDLSDHLDVVNMSIGGPYIGTLDDPDAVASNNAALAGVIVVHSAGNDGDSFYVTGARPARELVVASSVDSTDTMDAFRVNSPAAIAGVCPSGNSTSFNWTGMPNPVTGNLAYPADQSSGCAAFNTANAAKLSGKVALLDWTDNGCGSATRTNNAANAGAVGVIIAYNHPSLDLTIFGSTRIPATLTTPVTGNLLKNNVTPGVNVTLSKDLAGTGKIVDVSREDTLSSFTSRGPAAEGGLLKPEIAAPGQTIFAPAAGTGHAGISMNGTSMAAPTVAGALAALRQQHPDWSVEELKALVMNTATHDLFAGSNRTPPRYGVARAGAGRLDVAAASAAQAVAYSADEAGAVSVSFGALEVLGSGSWDRTVRVINKGASAAAFTLAYTGVTDVPGVAVSLPGAATLTLPAGGSGTVTVRLTADAALMKHSHDATVSETQGEDPRHWLTEMSGHVVLTPASGPVLRVPVWAAVRPASSMGAAPTSVVLQGTPAAPGTIARTASATGSFDLLLSGQQVDTGPAYPVDEVSLVSPLELQAVSADEPGSSGASNTADLRYVGVTSDYRARVAAGQGVAKTVLQFGVATYGDWSTPNYVSVRISIDADRDGVNDYVVSNGWASGAYDVFAAVVNDLIGGSGVFDWYLNGVSAARFDSAPFNTDVMVLPVSASALGLHDGQTRFNYSVETSYAGVVVDSTGVLTYDLASPGFDFTGGLLGPFVYFDTDANSIPVQYDLSAYLANASKGILLLHHHNVKGNRAQVVAVDTDADLALSMSDAPDPADIGADVTYTINVSNGGPATAIGASLTDTLPAGATFVSASASQGSCSGSGPVTCSLGALANGGAASATLVVKAGAAGTMTNTAAVSHAAGDPVAANNTATATTTVRSALPGDTQLIASVAHLPGGAGTQWRTNIAAVNRNGASPATVTLTYRPYAEGAAGFVRQASLPPAGTLEWQDILVSLFGIASTAKDKGTVEITSDVPLFLTSRTYNQAATGTFGQYYPSLHAAQALTSGQVGIIPHLKKTPQFRSNLGVLNLGDTACSVIVKLFKADGAQTGAAKTQTVAAGRYWQQDDIFGATGAGSQTLAYATVAVETAGGKVWAYGSVVDNATGDPTTIPLLTGDLSGPYLIASVAHLPGAGSTQWRTNVAGVNRNATPASLTLTYRPYAEAAAPVVRQASIPAGGTVEWQDLLVTLFGLASGAKDKGALEIAADVPVYLTSRTYNQASTGTFGQYYPALAASEGIGNGQIGVIPHLKKSAQFRTNFGVLNLGATACTVAVTLFRADGAQAGTMKTLTVAPGRFLQQDDIFGATGAGNQEIAYATVEVQSPGGKAWAYGSVVDNATGDPTTIPVLTR